MNLRFSAQGLLEAKRIKTWWQANRPAAPALFERELESALERIHATPHIGISYQQGEFRRASAESAPPQDENARLLRHRAR